MSHRLLPLASGWFEGGRPVAESADHCWEVRKVLAKEEAETIEKKGSLWGGDSYFRFR